MKAETSRIEDLGFDSWFQEKTDPLKTKDLKIARVVAVDKNSYLITNGTRETFAEPTGKMLFNAAEAPDLPVVGDWIYAQFFNEDTFAVIHDIFPRRSVLKRKTAGKRIDFQLIAANIDTALIMQSLDTNFNMNRLERYLVMAREGRIDPLVLLSKSDLISPEELDEKMADVRQRIPDVDIIAFSNERPPDPDRIRDMLVPGKTYCLLGSSGVGKTTLLNKLLKEERFETREIREKDGRGRHTTARRQLLIMETGAMIIDTPGMRELGMISMESGLEETFHDITGLSDGCRYKDCTHMHEKGCAVLAALEEGALSRERYENYIKMHKESVYHGMSYVEKRQKDKKFGKFIHSTMKKKKTGKV